jgi:hypothetical protein
MENLILDILLNYFIVGFICAAVGDIIIWATRSSETMTFGEIIATIIAWPLIAGSVLNLIVRDFFN